MFTIRPAEKKDIAAIAEIYNESVLNSTATFDTEPKTAEQQTEWFESHDEKHPVISAEFQGEIIGWASLSPWSDRPAYSKTAEISIYVKKEFRNRGYGKKLMDKLIEDGETAGLHTIIARIADGNEVSIKLHEEYGFKQIGIMKEVGEKFGKVIDVYLMQKIYYNKPA
jgi:L-amino acid N-acyltransferase YncA